MDLITFISFVIMLSSCRQYDMNCLLKCFLIDHRFILEFVANLFVANFLAQSFWIFYFTCAWFNCNLIHTYLVTEFKCKEKTTVNTTMKKSLLNMYHLNFHTSDYFSHILSFFYNNNGHFIYQY